jgi:DNA-binding SARP family transcriptional activator
MSQPSVLVSLLGPLELTVAGRSVPVGGPGRQALLVALALEVGRVVTVHEIFEAIWDDRPPATALTKLHGHVCALRRDLAQAAGPDGAAALQTKASGYVLCSHRATTDLLRFDRLLCAAATAVPGDAKERAARLSAALALWRGPACGGVASTRLAAAVTRLDERRWRATEDLSLAQLALGDDNGAIAALEWLVEQVPYRERAWELLLRVHLRRGDTWSARAAYEQLAHVLDTGLGVAPGERIGRLMAGRPSGR